MGVKNPYRYRGYRYDTETGLYYLQSRYYNPDWGRFVNADDYSVLILSPNELTDKNLFSYCDNNPVIRVDNDGEVWYILIGAAAGGVFSIGWQMIVEKKSFTKINWFDVGAGIVRGGLAATGVGIYGQVFGNAAMSVTSYASSRIFTGKEVNVKDLLINGAAGAVSGFVG